MINSTAVTGAAGEYYVMYQLLSRNLVAAIAPPGVPTADILVTDTYGDQMCAVQVKTRRDPSPDAPWQMMQKHETFRSANLIYVFVQLAPNLDVAPRCWVMPAVIVADVLERSHQMWLTTPAKRVRNDSNLRRMRLDYDKHGLDIGCPSGWMDQYAENWDIISKTVR